MSIDKRDPNDSIAGAVLNFYRTLPFNKRDSLREAIRNVKSHDPAMSYPPLAEIVSRGRILEVGCGVGWFSNGLAYHHASDVTGIDFNPVAIEQSRAVAENLDLKSSFQVADLFTYQPQVRFDTVVSLGVLHHTENCEAALRRVCSEFVAENGTVVVGLYHRYGRRPFLEHFKELANLGNSEDTLLEEYGRLHSRISDKTHLRSWFRDQVLHPHETQHTFAEVRAIVESCGMTVTATSLNHFARIEDIDAIENNEVKMEEISRQAIADGRYFPGFFVVFAQR